MTRTTSTSRRSSRTRVSGVHPNRRNPDDEQLHAIAAIGCMVGVCPRASICPGARGLRAHQRLVRNVAFEPYVVGRTRVTGMTVEKLKSFLRTHFELLVVEGGASTPLRLPEFDLTSFDYLDFAERSLAGSDAADKINCVAHLKRAAECQLDTFLCVMNLSPKREARSFPRKLESIQPFGFLSMRSIARLNRIRNRLEHEYAIPNDIDVELYFDLVSAFVYALEGFVLLLHNYSEQEWCNHDSGSYLRMQYLFSQPSIEFQMGESTGGANEKLVFGSDDAGEWNEAVRLFFLLARAADIVSADFVLKRLNSRERKSDAARQDE